MADPPRLTHGVRLCQRETSRAPKAFARLLCPLLRLPAFGRHTRFLPMQRVLNARLMAPSTMWERENRSRTFSTEVGAYEIQTNCRGRSDRAIDNRRGCRCTRCDAEHRRW